MLEVKEDVAPVPVPRLRALHALYHGSASGGGGTPFTFDPESEGPDHAASHRLPCVEKGRSLIQFSERGITPARPAAEK